MPLRSFTVYDIFKRNARVFGKRTALQTEERSITFGELFSQTRSVMAALASCGVGRGDRVALLTRNRAEFFPLFGAAAGLGAIVVPVNARLVPEEIRHILADTNPLLFFYEREFEGILPDLAQGLASATELIAFGEDGGGRRGFDSFLAHPAGEAAAVADDEPCVIIPTAAIQGKPRGAVLTHRNLVACSIHAASAIGLTYEDAYLNILPLFHIAGLMAALAVFHAGGRNLLMAKYDPVAAGRLIDREGVSFIGNFPPILTQLLDAQAAGECSLAALRHVLGVELPDTVKRFEKLGTGQFWLAYGQTETVGLTCFCLNAERPGSAGRPGPLVDLRIVDEADREVEANTPGEIVIRGPLVFAGYWGEKELTEQTLRGGWHHTGDVGRLDEEGFLFFVGRKAEKELIKPGGENVYPAEVEKAVLEHPAIGEVAVIGVPDPKFGEGIKAVCTLKEGARVTAQELIEFVGGRIARYKKPGTVEFVAALPKGPGGAVDRAKVKQLYGSGAKG